jgi:[NiFe] hydrogenase diaphorase moiety large subunit
MTAGGDRTRLLDTLAAAQARLGTLSDETLSAIAVELGLSYADVVDTASFYTFFSREREAPCRIRLSRSPVSLMMGAADVRRAFEQAIAASAPAAGTRTIEVGWTSDLGLADQEPAALIEGMVFTNLVPGDAAPIVAELRAPQRRGWSSPKAGCTSKIVRRGPVLLGAPYAGEGLRRALAMAPDAVVDEIARSGLRGRGGAGFPTGLKWRLTRQAAGETRYVVCNADEGEPGTFKDRVLLAEMPELVFDGLAIAGHALGAAAGFVYLRAEYAFLYERLAAVLAERRRRGAAFDIRLQLGAGAYVCGEESALIESLEGKRGAPRDRPPYPNERGYLGQPTAVNNVETLACVARILERGAAWFAQFGTAESKGTKLMCVSGDCASPGVYEVPFGISLNALLDLAGAADAAAVQVSGAAGECVAPHDFGRSLCYEDLSTGGSTMVFSPRRDLLAVVLQFADFFADESCGWCVPCRVGTVMLRESVERALAGRATEADLGALERLAHSVGKLSRCGLGQTAPNPILSTLRNFPHIYESRLATAGAP